MLVVKPKIRRAIESLRQGLLFMSVVQSRTKCTDTDASALTDAYVQAQLSWGNSANGSEHERVVKAVRERMRMVAANAKERTAADVSSALR